jgi:hypothetical protein
VKQTKAFSLHGKCRKINDLGTHVQGEFGIKQLAYISGVRLTTHRSGNRRSIQLSYGTVRTGAERRRIAASSQDRGSLATPVSGLKMRSVGARAREFVCSSSFLIGVRAMTNRKTTVLRKRESRSEMEVLFLQNVPILNGRRVRVIRGC